MPIVALVALGVPFLLLVLTHRPDRQEALGAAILGVVGSGLLLLFAASPGPEHTSEPHLEAYDEIAKVLVGAYAAPLLVVFVIALVVAERRTRRQPLPRAQVADEP